MKFIQYYLDCLSHASYLIGDETTGRAVVVDPQRDVAEYLADAKELGLTIELVIETHFHADFLSGHLELAKATGAKIVYSSVAETEFESMGVADGERYSLGEVTLEFRHTPGHTPESLSIVVYEHAGDDDPVRRADRRRAVHRRRRPARPAGLDRLHPRGAGRQALRLAARQADDAARRDPGVSGARRGLGVRQEPVDRSVVDDGGAEGDELRPAGARQGDVHGAGHRGAAARARLLRLRRDPQPQGPRTAGRDQDADGDDL